MDPHPYASRTPAWKGQGLEAAWPVLSTLPVLQHSGKLAVSMTTIIPSVPPFPPLLPSCMSELGVGLNGAEMLPLLHSHTLVHMRALAGFQAPTDQEEGRRNLLSGA